MKYRGKVVIGITGSFGSGKTTIAGMLRKIIESGNIKAEIIDADNVAKTVSRDRKISAKIKKEFKTTNRKKLAEIIFSDSNKLLKMNKIIHPVVIRKIKKEIKNEKRKAKKKIIILDVPLLFETGLNSIADTVIVVKCKKDIQIKRLIKKGFKKDDIIKRIESQLPIGEKSRFADYIIDNSKDLENTKKQITKIKSKIVVI